MSYVESPAFQVEEMLSELPRPGEKLQEEQAVVTERTFFYGIITLFIFNHLQAFFKLITGISGLLPVVVELFAMTSNDL